MSVPDRFDHYDSQEVNPFEIMDAHEAFQEKRGEEFSKEIGLRALRLMRAFGIASRSRGLEYEEGYSRATTLTHSKPKELDAGACARLSIKRESTGTWAPGEVRLVIGRLTRTGIGPISGVELDYIDEQESRNVVSLSRFDYSHAFPFRTPTYELGAYSDSVRSKDSFLRLLETVEQQAFPR